MQDSDELYGVASRLSAQAAALAEASWVAEIDALETAAKRLDRSASGSWLGYHANVYYDGLKPAPP